MTHCSYLLRSEKLNLYKKSDSDTKHTSAFNSASDPNSQKQSVSWPKHGSKNRMACALEHLQYGRWHAYALSMISYVLSRLCCLRQNICILPLFKVQSVRENKCFQTLRHLITNILLYYTCASLASQPGILESPRILRNTPPL